MTDDSAHVYDRFRLNVTKCFFEANVLWEIQVGSSRPSGLIANALVSQTVLDDVSHMNPWIQIGAVASGGAIGAVARFLLNSWAVRLLPKFVPAGTLLVNALGCLLIGVLVVLFESKGRDSQWVRAFFVTGLLGSLTTFSTFGYQTVELAREGSPKLAVANVVANLAIGIPAVMLGLWIGKRIAG